MAETIARQARIHGRVQGVSYRYHTLIEAKQLGVHGHVQNEPDGTVTLHAEGPEPAVAQLLRWCHQGPPHAQVTRIDESPATPTGTTTFEITHP